jgi:phosphate starvation-inducible protein PhoH and related proteins
LSKRKNRLYSVEQNDNTVVQFNHYYKKKRNVSLLPKTLSQEAYILELTNPDKFVVFATGPAGTGKTMLAMLAAIQALKSGAVNKIILTRPAVGVDDERHGFLPGDLNSKMEPWTRPLFDVLAEYYDRKEITQMLDEQIIEIAPLAFMRGRNLKNSFIVCDEMQNATVNQMKMVLTRIAEGSKLVVTGDLQQRDRKFSQDNGLMDFIERLGASESTRIAHVDFGISDVQRHPVVTEILNLYGEE